MQGQLHLCSAQQQLRFLGQQPFRAYASRSSVLGQVLYRLFAVDASTGVATGITYSIQQSTTDPSSSRHFFLRSDTGELEVAAWFSSLGEHRLMVEARSDSHPPVQVEVVVRVVRESDTAPRFESEAYELSVPESQAVGRDFSVIQASPLSSSPSSYAIISDTSGGAFSISSRSGLLSLARSLDREEVASYSLMVRYMNDVGFIDAIVIVNVLDTNDNAPNFSSSFYNVSIPEDLAVSTSITTISALDPDEGSNAMVQYTLAGSESTPFTLDPQSGILSVSASLDYERESSYQFAAVATDMGSPTPNNSTVTILVNIININDECPLFESSYYVVDIPSAPPPPSGQPVLSVAAFDPDGLEGGVTYSLSPTGSSPDANVFSLDSGTGEITVVGDVSSSGLYFLNISASNSSCVTPEAFALVEIRVVDVNDHSPVFAMPCNAVLRENPPISTVVTTLNATDEDVGVGGEIFFTLLNTTLFSVDERSGRGEDQ